MGFSIMSQNLKDGKCGNCEDPIAGVFAKGKA
jgi:hypothetical protein